MTPRRRRLLLGGLTVTWAAAFTATHLPPTNIPTTGLGDVYLHAAGYFLLGGLLSLALAACGTQPARRIAVTLAVLAVYAVVDEATQPLVGRTAALSDWFADMVGTAAAVAACEAVLYCRAR